jgi:non-specific serine/threonine protein kinase
MSEDVRLLTLTGPPGVGKTRLAIAIAEELSGEFAQGVKFVDLAPIHEAALVQAALSSAFGVAEVSEKQLLDNLVAVLSDQELLLVLDNFEQVLPSAAWIAKLLERTSGVKVLATSRERLRLRWERTLVVLPLSLPDLGRPLDLTEALEIPSIKLFYQRAQAINAEFQINYNNLPAVAEICLHLDGLPLAIELAAARVGVLSPEEMVAHLERRFKLLKVGAQDLPERHQTLRAAIDWSFEGLLSDEQRFLSRLSVFAGGFTATAAEQVAQPEALDLDTFDTLPALVEKNLVQRNILVDGVPRYRMLESIREYLVEKLHQSEDFEQVYWRHAQMYTELAEQNYAGMKGAGQKVWFDRLESEHDNFRAALQWSLTSSEPQLGLRISAALWYFWWLRGHVREGLHWLERSLQKSPEIRDEIYLRALEGAGTLAGWQGDYQAGLGWLMESLNLARALQDPAAEIRIFGWTGWIMWVNGQTENALWLADQLAASNKTVDPWDLAYAHLSLGSLLYEKGEDQTAEKVFREAIGYFQFTEEKHGVAFAQSKLALLLNNQGERTKAKDQMLQGLIFSYELNDLHVMVYCTDDALQLVAESSLSERIARLFGAVDRQREVLSLLRTPRERAEYERIQEALQRRLGEAQFASLRVEGQSLPFEPVVQETQALIEALADKKKSFSAETPDGYTISLSDRERQVLILIAEGLSNQEVADRMFISERTVRFHVTSIFNKLGVENRAQAVASAGKLGLLR